MSLIHRSNLPARFALSRHAGDRDFWAPEKLSKMRW